MTVTNKSIGMPPLAAPATTPTPEAVASSAPVDDEIVARPLTSPDFINLRPKNPEVSLRWINFKVGEKQSTLRYEQALAQGYVNAVVADIAGQCPAAYQRDGGTKIINGDLILMKHSRKAYQGAIKYKDQQAMVLAAKTGNPVEQRKEVQKGIAETGAPPEIMKKVSVFTPSAAEMSDPSKL